MNTDYGDEHLDRELLLEQLHAAVLRGQLALITGEDETVSQWLGELAVNLSDDTEVVRLDASQAHTASGLVQAVIRALDVAADDLLPTLKERAQSLPLVLVVDNGECLGSRALDALRNLLAKGGGGLGVLMGGEADLPELLTDARLQPAYRATATDAPMTAEVPEPTGAVTRPWTELVPWKHLAAVLGLLLLVWLFWPDGASDGGGSTARLELPAPDTRQKNTESGDAEAAADASEASTVEEGGGTKAQNRSSSRDQPTEAAELPPTPAEDPAEPAAEEPDDADEAASPEVDPSSLDAELAYRGEDWLLLQESQRWMLQLALAGDEARARELLDRLGRERGAYYRARRDGETAYVVLAGPYGSRDQALGARSDLPAFFRDRGPFPRSIGDIADEIRE